MRMIPCRSEPLRRSSARLKLASATPPPTTAAPTRRRTRPPGRTGPRPRTTKRRGAKGSYPWLSRFKTEQQFAVQYPRVSVGGGLSNLLVLRAHLSKLRSNANHTVKMAIVQSTFRILGSGGGCLRSIKFCFYKKNVVFWLLNYIIVSYLQCVPQGYSSSALINAHFISDPKCTKRC